MKQWRLYFIIIILFLILGDAMVLQAIKKGPKKSGAPLSLGNSMPNQPEC